MKVKHYRKKLGLTQEDIARIFEISTSAYNQKERCKTKFTYDEMKTMKLLVNRDVDPNATIDSIFFADE